MVIVRSETDPAGAGFGENALLTLAPGKLVKEAEVANAFVARLPVVVIAPASIVFVRFPFTVMVAMRVRVQLLIGGSVPSLKEKELDPGVPVNVPPQLPTLNLTGLAKIMPAGMLSVKAIPVRVTLPGLINSMLMVEAAPPKTSGG